MVVDCLVSIDCQIQLHLKGFGGTGLKDVLLALFLKEGTVEEWIPDSLLVELASGKGSRAAL